MQKANRKYQIAPVLSKELKYYARIEGFISTTRKNNRTVFSELCTTFEGYNFITAK
ncbi:hypothetical protein SDC9_196912 [bioreactor metagenome]|uniref:Uncharacterized protein n=1 Tax=bioreactor metagenome TaxID=1076179 RepID=A0A645IDB7_9ZZZZ